MNRVAAVLVLDDSVQDEIVHAVVAAHRLDCVRIAPGQPLPANLNDVVPRIDADSVWFVELDRLHREALAVSGLLARIRAVDPGAHLILSQSTRLHIGAMELGWARSRGALALLPSLAGERFDRLVEPALRPAIEKLGVIWKRPAAASLVKAIHAGTARPLELVLAHRRLAELEAAGVDLPGLARWAGGGDGFDIRDRTWRLERYPAVFVGHEAVDRLCSHLQCDREAAVAVGELMRQARAFHHVVKEHTFKDEELYYRLTPVTDRLAALPMSQVVAEVASRAGFERRDRAYLGRTYPNCFVGIEVVDWMKQRWQLTDDEALTLGQALMDLGMVRHVHGEHEFRRASLFYEFAGFVKAGLAA